MLPSGPDRQQAQAHHHSARYNVAYEDLRAIALAALRHRVLLNFEGQAEGVSTDDVVQEVVTIVAEH